MLLQYGIATPSSLTPVLHPEDAQPNERINKRNQKLPPRVASVAPPARGTSNYRGSGDRGGYRGRYMHRGGPFTQYAIRGNNSWRGRGGGSSRGRSQNPPLVHWSRQAGGIPAATQLETARPPSSTATSSSSSRSKSIIDLESAPQESGGDTPGDNETAALYVSHSPTISRPEQPEPDISGPTTIAPPHWLFRSRSPSPKLPPSPLKRRKLEHVYEPPESEKEASTMPIYSHPPCLHPLIETIPTPTPPLIPRPKAPLPGRQRQTPDQTDTASEEPIVHIKEERFSPVKSECTTAGFFVKKESRSPSPSLSGEPSRRLVTESINFYALPESCQKSNPQFRENRKSFFQEKNRALLRLGLKKKKAFYRDDGLVIEWSSSVPVWSDTLRPDIPDLATAIQRVHEMNDLTTKTSPNRTPKRRKVTPVSSKKGVSVVGPASSQSSVSKRLQSTGKEPEKHWAAGIPMEVLERSSHLISPSPVPESHPSPRKRLALPTRQNLSSSSSSSGPTNTQSESPTSTSRKQQLTSAKTVDDRPPSQLPVPRRMVFKPTNPRRIHLTSKAHVTPPEAQDLAGRTEGLLNAPDDPTTRSDTFSRVGHLRGPERPREMLATTLDVPELSYKLLTPVEVLTPEYPVSPTLVNDSRSTTTTTQAVGRNDGEAGHAAMPMNDASASDMIDLYEAEKVGRDLLRGLTDGDFPEPDHSDEEAQEDPEIVNDAKKFLASYIQLFDSDRSKLGAAYAKDALFSCRVHHVQDSTAGLFAPEMKPSFRSSHLPESMLAVEQGRPQICDRLHKMGPYMFGARPKTEVFYDMATPLLFGAEDGVLVSVHGEVANINVTNPQLDHVLTVDQSFVLRRRSEQDDIDDDINRLAPPNLKDVWPLVAVSHQMTVRAAPLLSVEELEERVPWICDAIS